MEVAILFLVLLLLFLGWYILKPSENYPKFPPGPRFWFPVLGHLPLLGKQAHKTLFKWKRSYGSIVGLWFGNHRAIVLNDSEAIREAFSSSSLAGRPPMGLFKEWGKGLITSEGHHHTEQRRFFMRQIKDYGFGKARIEARIQDEILHVVETLKREVGKPLSIHGKLELPSGRVIWNFLMPQPPNQADHELAETLASIARMLRDNTATVGIIMFLPWLGALFPKLSGMTKYRQTLEKIQHFISNRVNSHNGSRQETPRGFVDAYMDQVSKTENPFSSFHPSHSTIVHILRDLLVAGAEAVGTSLTWLFAYMVTWPEIQGKLQAELDTVVGRERYPSLADRAQMPYTLAVIYELLRFSSVGALGPAHSATEDTIFRGYHLPKGTVVIPNFYATHFDKEIWGDPENFRPERFLDSNSGKLLKANENFHPFSVGKRMCPGEPIAMDQLFLFTGILFQAFEVRAGSQLPSLEGKQGSMLNPEPFDVILTTR